MSYKCSICSQNYIYFHNAGTCCPLGEAIYSADMLNNWSAPDYIKTAYDEEYQGTIEDKTYE